MNETVILDSERVKTGVLMYLKEVHGIPMAKVRSVSTDPVRVVFEKGVTVPADFHYATPAVVQQGGGI